MEYEMLHKAKEEYWVYKLTMSGYTNEYVKKYSRMSAEDIYYALYADCAPGWTEEKIEVELMHGTVIKLDLLSKRNKKKLIMDFLNTFNMDDVKEVRCASHRNKKKVWQDLTRHKIKNNKENNHD